MVPMTLSSFIGTRPPDPAGVELMFMCTTVSTDAEAMTLAISGLRMSARTNSVRPSRRSIAGDGGTVSTPMTRPIDGSLASSAASAPPSHRLTPVTRTTAGGTSVSSLLVATLDARLLQQLAVLLLGHPLAALLDDRTHGLLPTSSPRGPAGDRWVTPDTVRGDQLSVRPPHRRGAVRRQSVPGRPAATLPRAVQDDDFGWYWRRRAEWAPEGFTQARRSSSAEQGATEPRCRPVGRRWHDSGDVGVGVAQVVLDGALRDAERATH